MWSRFLRSVDEQVAGLPVESRDRARAFVITLSFALAVSLISAVLAAASSLTVLAGLNVLNVVAIALLLPVYLRTWAPWVVQSILWCFLVTLSLGALATTPMEATTLAYLMVVPLLASLMFSRGETTRWFRRTLVVGLVTVVAGHLGWVVPEVDPLPAFTQAMNYACSLAAVLALLIELGRERDRSLARVQETERAKSALFANVGHELRTPMNGVLGMTDALLLRPMPTEEREMVEAIRASGGLLLSLLDDLLDLSKLEAGRLVVTAEPVVLEVFLAQSMALWRPAAEAKGLTLTVEVGDGLPSTVLLDPLRVRQVLGNLVNNALKFTAAGGVTVTVGREGPSLCFAVVDTGIGISVEQQARLFERFAQADDARARRFQGAGLGLALSRQLATRMGGTLEVTSTYGVGSHFSFQVPLVAATPVNAPLQGGLSRPLHVLVVDDNAINRLVARRLLERSGCTVEEAPDGNSALVAIEGTRFDGVLMDVQMPELDGLEVTRRVRAREGSSHLPIIGVSASAASEDLEQCRLAGMDTFIAKPVTHERLMASLEKACGAGRMSAAH